MSKTSDALRAAALGPAPSVGIAWHGGRANLTAGAWVPDADAIRVVHYYRGMGLFSLLSEVDQRLFLLLVAEAEE